MSYGNTIAALSKAPGTEGSALTNPTTASLQAIKQDPVMSGLRNLVDQQVSDSQTAKLQQRDVVDQAYDRVSSRGISFITPEQSAAYQQAAAALDADPSSESAYAAFAAARQPIFEAGLPYSSEADRAAVADAEVMLGQANVEVANAIQYKSDVLPSLDAEMDKLVHGDADAEGDIGKSGMGEVVTTKLEALPSDVAVLSGGDSAMEHIARVDGTAPTTPAEVCDPNSFLGKGMQMLTDAAKLIKDFGKNVMSHITSILGPIATWTKATLATLRENLSSILSSVASFVQGAIATFKTWVDAAEKALVDAMTMLKNKAFLNFLDFTNPCLKDSFKEVINMNNVDQVALEKARNTA